MNALALLASGKPEYRPLLAEYARKVAGYRVEAMATWHYGYANLFLAEHVMGTGDQSVFDGMKRIALESAEGQSAVGTWGHKFAMPNGNLNGYGCMNQPGLSLAISMVLARETGVKDPVLDRAIAKAAAFLGWYVNKGAIPYGDHQPWPGHEDNGKCSSGAVLFDLLGDREAAEFFTKMSVAAYSERERGHTGNYFNMLWALPGVIRAGPVATGAYFKEQSWYYDLARGWDGSVAYPGSPAGEEEHGKYTNWDCTGSYLLAFAASQKSLCLTGRKPFSMPALTKMLASSDRYTRYGACEALGCLGPRADAAAPQLRASLQESDPWMQSLACVALPQLSESARKASVSDLLRMSVRDNPSDPRRVAQRAAAMALFSPFPGSRDFKSILTESLDGVDRSLLYPAVQSILQNEDSVARGAIARIYGKLDDRDLVEMLPAIVKAVEQLAPSDEMFGDGIRLAGLDLLSRLHLREGMALCVSVIEVNRWGAGKRLPRCVEFLGRYGAHARTVLPQLREMRGQLARAGRAGAGNENLQVLDKAIAAIEASTAAPTLVGLQEFQARR